MLQQNDYSDIVKLYVEMEDFVSMNPTSFLDGCTSDREKVERILNHSACKDFTCAINQITGWEVWEYGNDTNVESHWFHSVCKLPNSNLIIDGKGIRTESQMLKDYPKHSYCVHTDAEAFFANDYDLEKLMIFAKYIIKRDNLEINIVH